MRVDEGEKLVTLARAEHEEPHDDEESAEGIEEPGPSVDTSED